MRIQRGDVVFGAAGKPGVVQERDNLTGTLTASSEGSEIDRVRRIGFINGLRPGERQVFDAAITKMRETPSSSERLQTLTEIIDDLGRDPRNMQLVRYLESEKAHLMYSEGVSPRTFNVDETKV